MLYTGPQVTRKLAAAGAATPTAPWGGRGFPPWLKKPLPAQPDPRTQKILSGLKLNTVCQSAECPNLGECWSHGVATFMILGETCTRSCSFCAVKTGAGETLDSLSGEPQKVAEACKELGLGFVVVTSVARDDLPDEGAGHFAQVIRAIQAACGAKITIEVLVPDFHARAECIRTVLDAAPDVFNHNVETVERLYSTIRPQAKYSRTLSVLSQAKAMRPGVIVKSGLMVGFGETQDEVRQLLRDLRANGCDVLTIGQYLQPSKLHAPVTEYVTPEVFELYATYAKSLGFGRVASGPFVRSSYQAEEVFRTTQA